MPLHHLVSALHVDATNLMGRYESHLSIVSTTRLVSTPRYGRIAHRNTPPPTTTMHTLTAAFAGLYPEQVRVHQRGRITLYCVADSFDRKKLDEVRGPTVLVFMSHRCNRSPH
jgi:hypothetical protein